MSPRIKALVFDFDGLILETEMPAYRSWAETYREHGHELPRDRWLDYIGREAGWFDALIHLESLVTAPFDREAVRRRREERRAQLLAELDAMAGITDYVSEGRRLGLRLAIASSSPSAYVRAHLGRGGSRCRAGRGARARRLAKWDRGGEGGRPVGRRRAERTHGRG